MVFSVKKCNTPGSITINPPHMQHLGKLMHASKRESAVFLLQPKQTIHKISGMYFISTLKHVTLTIKIFKLEDILGDLYEE
jgi:hypothetical protein